MSARLSKDLCKELGVKRMSMPIRKDDEVAIVRGFFNARDGKVTQVYRRKFVIHVERLHREKANGMLPSWRERLTLLCVVVCFEGCFYPGIAVGARRLLSLPHRLMIVRPVVGCSGAIVNVGIHPSNVVITKLHMDKDRKNLIARKKAASEDSKGKYTDADAANTVE